MAARIMVFNDTQEILQLFEAILMAEGYDVTLRSYSNRELDEVRSYMPDLIVSDHPPFQEEQGWQFLQKLKMDRATATIPVIICTTSIKWLRTNVDEAWLTAKGIEILPKPFDIDEFLAGVRGILARVEARAEEPASDDEAT
jgi:DNA-binding response OmpR family regulator